MIVITIRTYHKSGPNGDRATHSTAYKDYKVVLAKVSGGEEVEVAEFRGYDGFQSHVLPDRRKEAEEYANKLWDFFSGDVADIHHEQYREKVVTQRAWERVG